ncbi:hypothetical protein TRIUR3_21499 [Triticum urartu]|uniref:Uncharacterized protein n=1 Tax=Triticum urartu TaxID=4572 RepID=M7ZKW0_TRIUA|nr:hypothetical protein TRIUR3_21499 [Triticum urartu]
MASLCSFVAAVRLPLASCQWGPTTTALRPFTAVTSGRSTSQPQDVHRPRIFGSSSKDMKRLLGEHGCILPLVRMMDAKSAVRAR